MAEYATVEEAYESLREHELATNSRYAAYKATKNFGSSSLDTAKKVFWQDQASVQLGRQELSGIPFVVLGQKVLDCQFGKNRKEKQNRKIMEKTIEDTQGRKFKIHESKKVNCPARCVLREICRFPTYKKQNDSSVWLPNVIADNLLTRIKAGEDVEYERVIITHMPSKDEHTCHSLGETTPKQIDPRIAKKIKELCQSGVRDLKTMRPLLQSYVEDICTTLPHPSDKRFYPSDKCIGNHMNRACKGKKREHQQILHDKDPPDLTISDKVGDTSQGTVQELREKVAQPEKEKLFPLKVLLEKMQMTEYSTVEEAYESLREHELATNSRYAAFKATKDFGRSSLDTAKKVFWQDQASVQLGRQEFSGIPFVVLGQKRFDCQFGKNRKEKRKRKIKEKTNEDTQGRKFKMHDTKKVNCPARCVLREICRFPTYKIQNDSSVWEANVTADNLLTRIKAGEDVEHERVIITLMPSIDDHTCHSLGENTPERIDPRIAKKIKELCQSGVRNLKTMRPLLQNYVQDICTSLPHPSNKRFYPSDKCIGNHMYIACKGKKHEHQQILHDKDSNPPDLTISNEVDTSQYTFQELWEKAAQLEKETHPSVRIKGTETNYIPVQCFDPVCADKMPHMHCPFCVKTESYTDPVILKAHYRVKHVDKGIEFAGLKVLRCCDRCDIVGVIKGEKKFKGAHWHCYKCRNGFNRRDEAIKHYKTHFRNPQTTFQIQIAQDINQPVTQAFETEEAAACIPTDSFSVHAGLAEGVSTHSSGISMLPRGLEGMVAMPGVGAVETVGVSDTQTIMIIQDDGQGNLSTMQEFCTSQDSNPPDLTITDEVDDTSQDTVQELQEKIAQLEKEKAEQKAHIALLSKKIEEQAEQIAAYKMREQSLLEQMEQIQESVSVPQDRAIQDLCNQLENQHKELIRQQITQLKHSLVQTTVQQPKMIVLNAGSLGAQLGHTVNLHTFDTNGNNATQVVALDFKNSAGVSEVNSGAIQTEEDTYDTVEDGKETDEIENDKDEHFDKETEYPEILVHSLPHELDQENPVIENDGSICDEPERKRRKEK